MAQMIEEFKETEVGMIPAIWDIGKLGEVSRIVTGKKDVNQGNAEGKYPFFTCARNISWSDDYSFDCEAILIAGNGVVGNTHYYSGKFEAYQRTYVVSEFNDSIEVGYLYAFLAGNLEQDLLRAKTGSTMPYIRKGDLVNYPIPLPPLDEQRRIAAVLTAIQDAIAAQEDVIAAARAFKRSLMHRLFTYGPGRVPAETKETEIGEIPSHWEVGRILDYAVVKTSTSSLLALKKVQVGPSELGKQVLYLKVSDFNLAGNEIYLKTGQTAFRVPSLAVKDLNSVPSDSVVFPKRGAAIKTNKKRMTTCHCLLDPNLIAVIPDSRVSNDYLFDWFMSFDLATITDDNTIPQLNKKDVERIQFAVPSLHEQIDISVILDSAEDKIAAEEDRKAALDALFKSMLHQLMTGQIRLLSDEGLNSQLHS